MHDHIKCNHELKHCADCDVVYCEKCKTEWFYNGNCCKSVKAAVSSVNSEDPVNAVPVKVSYTKKNDGTIVARIVDKIDDPLNRYIG